MVKPGEWISQGWEMVKPYLGTYILTALVAGLLSAVSIGILAGPLTCGWFMMLLRQRREPSYEPQFGDLWKGFEVFGQSFVAWLLITIVLTIAGGLVGVIASVIAAVPIIGQLLAPMTGAVIAICAMVVFLYVFPLVADRRIDAVEAIRSSARKTGENFAPFAGFAFILYLLNAIGAALCGIGWLVTTPVVMAAIAVSYEDLIGGSAVSPAPDAAQPEVTPSPEAPRPTDEPGPQ